MRELSFYQHRFHLENAHFIRIDHEDAMVATVFKVTLPNLTHLILKICSREGDYLREVYYLNHFAGVIPIPRLMQHIPPDAILMEYLPGTILQKRNLSERLSFQIGSLLAQIHRDRVAGYGDLAQPNQLNSDPRISFTQKFEEGFEECRGHLPSNLMDKCRQYYDQHIDLLLSTDGPCVVHRDFRPGNCIVHHDQIQGIIDWSSARGGFAEEDFCPLEFGDWSSFKDSFLAGYSQIREVPNYRPILSFLHLSRAIGAIGFTVKRGTWQGKGARIYQENCQFLHSLLQGQS